MNCPICYANSVIIKNGRKQCEAKGCYYLQFNVISYKNEIRNFEDKLIESRCDYQFNPYNSEINKKIFTNFLKNQKKLKTLGEIMKLPDVYAKIASSKLKIILTLKYTQKEQQVQNRIKIADELIVGYALYCACFEKGILFKDVRIANELGISKKEWEDLLKKLNFKTCEYMNVPQLKLQQQVLRIPEKHKINQTQKLAMVEMIKRIKNKNLNDNARNVTVCAFVFQQIMKRSQTYYQNFKMKKYIKSQVEQDDGYWRQQYFQITLATVKNYAQKKIGNNLLELIPDFKTKINENLIITKQN